MDAMSLSTVDIQTRDEGMALAASKGLYPGTIENLAFANGYAKAKARLNTDPGLRSEQGARRAVIWHAATARQSSGQTRLSHLGQSMAFEMYLEERANDGDADDDEPKGPHKFSGTNVKKCADCGKSMKAQDHKQSWPPSWRHNEDNLIQRDGGWISAADAADKGGIQPKDSGDTSVKKHAFEGKNLQKCGKCGMAVSAAAHQTRGDDEELEERDWAAWDAEHEGNKVRGSKMTRQHFQHIADSIATSPISGDSKQRLADHFASHLGATNSLFNRGTFTSAATTSSPKDTAAKMTRSHFQTIADTLRSAPLDEGDRGKVASHFANRLQSTNSGFKPGLFVSAATTGQRYDVDDLEERDDIKKK